MRTDCRSQFAKGAKSNPASCVANKIVLASKSRSETSVPTRKPVKECYCISELPKSGVRSKTVVERTLFPGCNRDDDELVEIYTDTSRGTLVASLLGLETLRRAGRITYMPSSEFLRRVQKKVSYHRRRKPTMLPTESSSGASSEDSGSGSTGEQCSGRDSRMAAWSPLDGKNARRADRITYTNGCQLKSAEEQNSGGASRAVEPSRSFKSHSRDSTNRAPSKTRESKINCRRADETRLRVGSKKVSGETTKGQRVARTISAHSRCCSSKLPDEDSKSLNAENHKTPAARLANQPRDKCDCRTACYRAADRENVWQLSRDRVCSRPRDNEERVKELSKFRRANYFETHGSIDTLVGETSRTSMSTIERCELNDRLFAGPQCCSGKHAKRIHYYPSYVVREERLFDDTTRIKTIRPRNCEVTGHVIDLGILKIPCEFSNNLLIDCHRGRDHDE